MFAYLPITLAGLALLWLSKTLLSLHHNIAVAKISGLPYAIAPVDGIAGFFWTGIHDVVLGILKALPYSQDWLWVMLVEPHRGWHYAQELRELFGEVFLVISPRQVYMNCSNAEAIMQMTTRRNEFPKPVEIYGIVDIFGQSVLTTEGADWKRHRKIVAPAFSEKSNALVWKESLRQAASMLKFWSKLQGNGPAEIRVKDTAPDMALMALHVISGAGFGVRQVWDGESEEQLGTKVVPGFNTAKLKGKHRLSFKDSLNTLLHGMIWVGIFPIWLLEQSPFKIHKKLLQSYLECGNYFKELSENKVQQLECGETAEKGTMDLLGPLVKASENKLDKSKELYLTKQEVIANSWIFLFAGHETSANTLHFSLLFLATALNSQARLQADIDSIVGSRPSEDWTYETDMGRLYLSMVGATMNETLRLMPPIIDIPKITRAPQSLTFDGKTITLPTNTFIHISAVGVHRNPRYWPHNPSKITSKAHDLDDFVPERWLPSTKAQGPARSNTPPASNRTASTNSDGLETASFESSSGEGLFTPSKGAFVPFSEGARSCPGRRFAQVEITAVLAVIFKTHSLELDVAEWASDAEVQAMGVEARREVYEVAKARARKLIGGSETIVTLQMRGPCVPVRFMRRGEERFKRCYVQ